MLTLYGIPNCGTVKKALQWLNEHQVTYQFHDYKKKGADAALLGRWAEQVGLASLINRTGTTWRNLTDAQKDQSQVLETALPLLTQNTSLIKRPIITDTDGNIVLIGFQEAEYGSRLLS
jgi:Spx/MgsR family transcriptional regulator